MLSRLAVALVHAPVLNRRGDTVATAVTNLDLHDIARICRTYGVGRFYVVTPDPAQQRIARAIIAHWQDGFGAGFNPDRADAFGTIRLAADLGEARSDWQQEHQADVLPVLTSARRGSLTFFECRDMLQNRPLLLVFGTGSGLAPELDTFDWPTLEPLQGAGDYNHLPVRAAAAVILDRLNQTTTTPRADAGSPRIDRTPA